MESLRKTARVLDVVARIAFWVTMVVGALLLLLWALNLRDPFFTKYMGGLLMAGNLNFTLAEPVNFPWGPCWCWRRWSWRSTAARSRSSAGCCGP